VPARILLALVLLLPSLSRAQVTEPFALVELANTGRTVTAELGDFDGDGVTDLLQVAFIGIPPNDTRLIRLWTQNEKGELGPKPKYELPLPEDSAAYDFGDVLPDSPGLELLLLRPQGVTILSFANPALPQRDLSVSGGTMIPAEDERGLDRLRLFYPELGTEPLILVPLLAHAALLTADGVERARLEVGARANYFVQQRPGAMLTDSDIQLLLDVPRIAVGDVDGDSRADVVASGRHWVRVFLQREDGKFPRKPDRALKLGLVSEKDQIRGSGSVRVDARDVSGDGKLDLLISHLSGGLTDAQTETKLYLNREGQWDMSKPDFAFEPSAGWGADQLVDIDQDGKPELMHVAVAFGVLDLIQALVTRSIDANIGVYRASATGVFAKEPWFERKLTIAMSFDTARPLGFVPTGNFDVNGDGFADLLTPGKGDRIDVWLGSATGMADAVSGEQKVPSSGRLRAGDWNGDGLADLLLYDPRQPGSPVQIARNKGLLPGTLPHIGAPTSKK